MVKLFRTARALSPDTAQSLGALGVNDGVPFTRLKRRAILREVDTGRFYLDEQSWVAFTLARRRLVVVMLLIVLALVAAGALVLFVR